MDLIGASSAYAEGATGQDVTIAVIDTGTDFSHPDLQGKSAGFFDVRAADRQAGDIDSEGHGTLVSGQLAALRDGDGVHGLAFNSRILDIRADRPGSCLTSTDTGDCRFSDADLVTAIDYAVDNGAQIINLSLGGEIDADPSLEDAVFRATDAGVLVVVSAGNEARDEDGNVNPQASQPTEPANIAGDVRANGLVLAVGSTLADAGPNQGDLSDFSNRAGTTAQDFYILAPGDGVVTTGPDDDIVFPNAPTCSATVTTDCNDDDAIGDYYRVAGTSFAAPYVAGSLALLLDAFPNLSPADAVQILLDTADDYVDSAIDPVAGVAATAGTDAVSGVGSLNLQSAFSPQGATTMQVNGLSLSPVQVFAPGASGAFGDFATKPGGLSDLVLVDGFSRAFAFDASALVGADAQTFADWQTRAEWSAGDSRAVRAGGLSFFWHTPAYFEDRSAPFQVEPESTFSGRYAFAGGEVEFGRGGSLSSLAPSASLTQDQGRTSQFASGGQWARITHDVGDLSFDLHSATNGARTASGAGVSRHGETGGNAWTMRLGVAVARDQETALGGQIQSRIGYDDQSSSAAYVLEGAYGLGETWTLSGGVEAGSVDLAGLETSDIWTSRWSVSASRPLGGGELAFVVAQPQRAETGAFTLTGAVGADADGLVVDLINADLTPSGRQIDFETRYSFALAEDWTGEAIATVSNEPNHIADAGMASALWVGVRGRW
ncbi:MAG: S8 family peptidase [Pseudomonadota bacterium]